MKTLMVANVVSSTINDEGCVVVPLSSAEVTEIRLWPAPVNPDGGDAMYYARTSTGRLVKVGYTLKGTPAATPVDLEGCPTVWQ